MPAKSDDGFCPDCGFGYIPGLPSNLREHRKRHALWGHANHPKPNPALVGLGPFVPVSGKLNVCLYEIARALAQENRYDFVPWSKKGTDKAQGYLIVDEVGRAIGGFAVHPWDYEEGERKADWLLSWIFVATSYRRQGWLKRTWAMLEERYDRILPEPPFTREARAFFQQFPEIVAALRMNEVR